MYYAIIAVKSKISLEEQKLENNQSAFKLHFHTLHTGITAIREFSLGF
jgi:hypothetical protein